MTPFPFSPVHDAALLAAAGYTHHHYPAEWWDDGGPENGPHLNGHPDTDVWTLPTDGRLHEIVVVDEMVVEMGYVPDFPDFPEGEDACSPECVPHCATSAASTPRSISAPAKSRPSRR